MSRGATLVDKIMSDGCGRFSDSTPLPQSPWCTYLSRSRFNASGQLFTIRAKNNQTWVVHEAVLSKSPVLAKICQAPMAESKTKVIEIPEDDPSSFGRLLGYLYCGEYSP